MYVDALNELENYKEMVKKLTLIELEIVKLVKKYLIPLHSVLKVPISAHFFY